MLCCVGVFVCVFVAVRVACVSCCLFYVLWFGVVAVVWLLLNGVLCLSECSLCVCYLCVLVLRVVGLCIGVCGCAVVVLVCLSCLC